MKHILLYILICVFASFASCIEDGFTTSPSDQPVFSTDTLDLGVVYTDELTVTSRLTVRNPHDKGLNISHISLSGDAAEYFRINVDGLSGNTFSDMEIRATDSIYVFVEAQLPENGEPVPVTLKANIDFQVNGLTSSVLVMASGQDIIRVKGAVITEPTTFTAGKPYQIKDSLVIASEGSLTLEAGARLLMHDKSYIKVDGQLIANGTSADPIVITGDRTGELLPGVSFDIMSRQWDGIVFSPSSHSNFLAYTEVSNTSYGVEVYGAEDEDYTVAKLTLENCRLRNSGYNVLTSAYATVAAFGCEFAEAAGNVVALVSGAHRFEHCTFSNYYLYSAPAYALVGFDSEDTDIKAEFANCILYGLSAELSIGDLTGYEVYFRNCLFRSQGTDDDNFVGCHWDLDPLFFTVRNEYYFDYRLQPESPVWGLADASLNTRQMLQDYYGTAYSSTLGAFQ